MNQNEKSEIHLHCYIVTSVVRKKHWGFLTIHETTESERQLDSLTQEAEEAQEAEEGEEAEAEEAAWEGEYEAPLNFMDPFFLFFFRGVFILFP